MIKQTVIGIGLGITSLIAMYIMGLMFVLYAVDTLNN